MIAQDKIDHIIAGFAISIFSSMLFGPVIGFVIATAVGIGKECIWDRWLMRGRFEYMDMVATSAGGALASLFIKLIF